jgi:cysteinyl-tRNA synthetase
MPLRLYNTLTQKVEDFVPLTPGKVNLYVCGITTYDLPHAGHARTYTTFDVLVRFLRARGFEVKHCRNVTDVDDKIVNRAKEKGQAPLALSKHFSDLADAQLKALGCLPPDVNPRVSTSMKDIVALIEKLIAKGAAYVAETPIGKDVYYSIKSFPPYGKLSRRNLEDLRAGASERLAENANDVKQDPLDFALWKAAAADAFGFDSPWGRGRPGWHIECSAMALKELGEHIDIHGGGMDLIFPHHENEVAQSEAIVGPELAKFWMHAGFLNLGEKMSKSLGNVVTIQGVLENSDPEAFRYFCLGSHYRGPLNYEKELLDEAEKRVEYLYTTKDALTNLAGDAEPRVGNVLQGQAKIVDGAKDRVLEALDKDLNTSAALSVLAELGKASNEIVMQSPKHKKDPAAFEAVRQLAAAARDSLRDACAPLGLMQADSEAFWKRTKERRLRMKNLDEKTIDAQVAARAEARKAKDFAKADALRKELAALGVEVFDAGDASTWKITL